MVKCKNEDCKGIAKYGLEKFKPIRCKLHKEENDRYLLNIFCNIEDCFKYATHSPENEKPLTCEIHKLDNYIKTKKSGYKKCIIKKCENDAKYGSEKKKPIHCNEHRLDNEYYLLDKLCSKEECFKKAGFAPPGEKGITCGEHKLDNYVNVRDKICNVEGCGKIASFGIDIVLTCGGHKLDGYKNIKSKKCKFLGCERQPSFGFVKNRPLYCSEHRDENCKDVVNKLCEYEACESHAHYGLLKHKPIMCGKHKLEEHINVMSVLCHCGVRASYGPRDGSVKRCTLHKLSTDVDKVSRKCMIDGCETQPSFSSSFDEKPKRCALHKFVNDINVINTRCSVEGCDTSPSYGSIDAIGKRCSLHRLETDINVVNKLCNYEGCNKRCSFGLILNQPITCFTHKLDAYKNVRDKVCESCNLYIVHGSTKLCSYCNPKSSKRLKQKEEIVNKFLQDNGYRFIREYNIGKSCGSNRIDFLIDCGSHIIALEVDEHQHSESNYLQSCEYARMNNIQISLGQPTVFIRFNPDTFKLNIKTKKILINERLELLKQRIDYHMNNLLLEPISIEYLYYDFPSNLQLEEDVDEYIVEMFENIQKIFLY